MNKIKFRQNSFWLAFLALIGLLLAQPVNAAPSKLYKITDLAPNNDYGSRAYGINDDGQVAGWFGLPQNVGMQEHAFLWGYGKYDLDTLPGGYGSAAYDVNKNHQVVGWSAIAGMNEHAFLWSKTGGMSDLGTLPGGAGSAAYAINEVGQVVGWSENDKEKWRAFLYENGVMSDLGVGGYESRAYDINDSGQVVGWLTNSNGERERAFLWENNNTHILDTLPGGTGSVAYAVNNAGQAVGRTGIAGGAYHAVRWENDKPIDLGTLGGDGSSAFDINEAGQVVGLSNDANGEWHAFLWENDEMYDLNDWLLPESYDWTLVCAQSINKNGQIVGWGYHGNKYWELHAFLATVPEPISLLLLSAGLLGMGITGWRKS